MSVFVIRSNLLMFDYIFFFPLSKNACIYWLLPYLFGTEPQSYLRGYTELSVVT